MANKKVKFKNIVARTMFCGNKKGDFKAELIQANVERTEYLVKIFKQESKDISKEVEEIITKHDKRLVIRPDYEGLKEKTVKARVQEVNLYMESNTPEEALEQVPGETIESKNEGEEPTVLTWVPKIEKDLGYKIQKFYDNTPTKETIKSIESSVEYSYKEIESWTLYYRVSNRDFRTMINNFLNK